MEAPEVENLETQVQTDPDAPKQDPAVCKFFLRGRCHFGDRCRMSHSSTSDIPDQKAEQTDEQGCKKRKARRKSGKTDKPKEENNGPEKKLRMRTADDVISRILWDTSVNPADFVVGHLDRFLGLLERPFSDFSWDTQVCDCDYSEEMAIPRHRIQYFSYKGQRVWDRDSRTDHVFGSTGQSVMFPFDRGYQPQENFAPDTAEDREGLSPEKNEQGSINHRVMGAEDKETLSDAGANCSTNVQIDKDGEDAGLVQDTKGLTISSGDKQITTQEDSWVNEEEVEPSQPIPQVPLPARQPRKPTHFICFRVDSPAALRAFQLVQREVLTHLPQSEPWWVKSETLHVTLSLLILQSPAEVFAASELLRSVVRNFYKPPISVSFSTKLKHFNGKVLHVVPQPLSEIQNLNAPLQEVFRENGWLHRHSRNPNYHLTLAKVTDVEADKMFEEAWKIKLAKQLNFGKLTVDKLYLCVTDAPRGVNGFYDVVCSVQLPSV